MPLQPCHVAGGEAGERLSEQDHVVEDLPGLDTGRGVLEFVNGRRASLSASRCGARRLNRSMRRASSGVRRRRRDVPADAGEAPP